MSTTQIALRIPDDVLARLRKQAEAEYRSVTSLAIALIAQGLDGRDAADPRAQWAARQAKA